MLELDLILQPFTQNKLDMLSNPQVDALSELLACTDPQLYAWLMGHEEPSNLELAEIVTLIRSPN
jgi:antitoxin CptB